MNMLQSVGALQPSAGAPQSPHRILVMSHRHPDFSLGGGEIAAYNLYKAYRDHVGVEDAWFLASADALAVSVAASTFRIASASMSFSVGSLNQSDNRRSR